MICNYIKIDNIQKYIISNHHYIYNIYHLTISTIENYYIKRVIGVI